MTAATVNALAEYLAAVDADWRKAAGYTGKPVHRRAYWRNMAARLLADSVKAIKPNSQARPSNGSGAATCSEQPTPTEDAR